MKIVCESCGAKYSIADEKVAGKVFKIRCKRCSEVLVVRGDEQAQQPEAAPIAQAPAADAIWHVVVNGEQAGPYAVAQLSDMLSAGTVDWEAYVWTEGFDNWVPMRDVEDLVAQITGEQAQPQAQAAAAVGYGAAGSASLDAQPSMGADPFADDSGRSDAGMFEAPVATGNAPDLFGAPAAADASPFGGAPSPGVIASGPSPRVSSEQAMTGARNENSVLFSLKNLQALATGGSGNSSAPAPTSIPSPGNNAGGGGGFATAEGSGLIDIRALASATGVGEGGGGDKDELLSMGAQGGAFSAMASPMLAPSSDPGESNKTALYVAVVAAVGFLALAAVAVVYIMRPPATPAQPTVAATSPAAAAAAAVPGAEAEPKPADEDPEPPSEGELAAKAAAEEAEEDDDDKSGRRRKSRSRSSSSSRGESKKSTRSDDDGDDKAAAKPAPAPSKPSGPRTLDALLDNALSGKKRSSSRSPEPAPSNLPDKPSRDAVVSAMKGVTGAVQACAKGQSGVAFVNVTVAGKTGRVTNAQVSGITGPAGSCIAKAVRRAKFPRFSANQFKIKYPFRL